MGISHVPSPPRPHRYPFRVKTARYLPAGKHEPASRYPFGSRLALTRAPATDAAPRVPFGLEALVSSGEHRLGRETPAVDDRVTRARRLPHEHTPTRRRRQMRREADSRMAAREHHPPAKLKHGTRNLLLDKLALSRPDLPCEPQVGGWPSASFDWTRQPASTYWGCPGARDVEVTGRERDLGDVGGQHASGGHDGKTAALILSQEERHRPGGQPRYAPLL